LTLDVVDRIIRDTMKTELLLCAHVSVHCVGVDLDLRDLNTKVCLFHVAYRQLMCTSRTMDLDYFSTGMTYCRYFKTLLL